MRDPQVTLALAEGLAALAGVEPSRVAVKLRLASRRLLAQGLPRRLQGSSVLVDYTVTLPPAPAASTAEGQPVAGALLQAPELEEVTEALSVAVDRRVGSGAYTLAVTAMPAPRVATTVRGVAEAGTATVAPGYAHSHGLILVMGAAGIVLPSMVCCCACAVAFRRQRLRARCFQKERIDVEIHEVPLPRRGPACLGWSAAGYGVSAAGEGRPNPLYNHFPHITYTGGQLGNHHLGGGQLGVGQFGGSQPRGSNLGYWSAGGQQDDYRMNNILSELLQVNEFMEEGSTGEASAGEASVPGSSEEPVVRLRPMETFTRIREAQAARATAGPASARLGCSRPVAEANGSRGNLKEDQVNCSCRNFGVFAACSPSSQVITHEDEGLFSL